MHTLSDPAAAPPAADWPSTLPRGPVLEGPVLRQTALALDEWRALEDSVDAHRLAPLLVDDPLACGRLLWQVGRVRPGREHGIETPTEALVMLGIGPFFRAFAAPLSVAESLLSRCPAESRGFDLAMQRSALAGQLALAFAAHRQDQQAAVVQQAAVMHALPELLWRLRCAQQATARGTPARAWRPAVEAAWWAASQLPLALAALNDPAPSRLHQVCTVQLAVRLARQAVPRGLAPPVAVAADEGADLVDEVAQLLQLNRPHCLVLLRSLLPDAPGVLPAD